MIIKLEISDEARNDLILEELKSQIESFKLDVKNMKKNKVAVGYESWNYKEDYKAVKKMLKSLELIFDFYGGNI